MASSYPKPDRSDIKPNFSKTEDNDALDISWQGGVLRDGRPFRGELWAQDSDHNHHLLFSTLGLENATKEDLERLVSEENLVKFKPGKRYVTPVKVKDASDHEMWSINVVVGDDENTYVEGGRPLTGYSRD